MTLEIQILTWYRHKNVAESNQLMESYSRTNDNNPLLIQIGCVHLCIVDSQFCLFVTSVKIFYNQYDI